MSARITAVVILATALLASACSSDQRSSATDSPASAVASPAVSAPARSPGEAADLAGLRVALDEAGLPVGDYRRDKLRDLASLFPGLQRYDVLPVGQAALNVFRFADNGAAAEAGARVDAEGGLPTVEFVGAPHFFRQGRTIVLYVEEDRPSDVTVLGVLVDRLGARLVGEE